MYMDVEMDIPRYDYQTQNFSQNFYEEVNHNALLDQSVKKH